MCPCTTGYRARITALICWYAAPPSQKNRFKIPMAVAAAPGGTESFSCAYAGIQVDAKNPPQNIASHRRPTGSPAGHIARTAQRRPYTAAPTRTTVEGECSLQIRDGH